MPWFKKYCPQKKKNKFIYNLKMNVYNDYIHFNNKACLLTRLAFYITLYFYNS